MNVRYRTNYILTSLALLMLRDVGFAQFYNNGNQITVGNNAVVYIKGMDLINVDSSIYNAGSIVVEGNCTIGKKSTSRIITLNGDSLIVYKNFTDSSITGQRSGVLSLKGTAIQSVYSSSNRLSSLHLNGIGDKVLTSNILLGSNLSLQNGHIVTGAKVFQMDSTASLSPATIGVNSFIVGALYRKRKTGAEDSLYFPIGDSNTEYRPATLVGIASPVGQYPVFGVSTSNGATPNAGIEVSTVYSRIWSLDNPTNASVQNIRLYYQPSEVGSSPAANLVVAQSAIANGYYNSIGAENATSVFVKSALKPTLAYYTIGASSNLRGNFKVLLEGPITPGGSMRTNLYSIGVLDTLLKTHPMASGYSVPSSAVDRIAFALIDSISGLSVDTAYAWLLSDGHIRDYATGNNNYVTFGKASASSRYFVYVSHRNHLPASSQSLVLTSAKPSSTTFNYDYSKGVYGGGAMYQLSSGSWLLYASDPYKSWKNQTDVLDLGRTWFDEDGALYRAPSTYYYHYTDLDLNGVVNSSDQQIANVHNLNLYYSTLPK